MRVAHTAWALGLSALPIRPRHGLILIHPTETDFSQRLYEKTSHPFIVCHPHAYGMQ